MKTNILLLLTTLSFCYFLTHKPIRAQSADRVFYNGKIYTANDAQPFAQALAIKNDKIIFVGSDAGVQSHVTSCTIVEDLNGRLILPGLHDIHTHPLEAGTPIGGDCELDGLETDAEQLGLDLFNCGLSPNANGWIIATGHSLFALLNATRPPYQILDDYYPNTPVVVMEETSHSVWVNSEAMFLANITSSTPDPVGGHIYKDSGSTQPSGIMFDNAGDAFLALALQPNATIDNQNYDGLVNFSLPLLSQHGITSVCEARTYWKRNYIQIWKDVKNAGLLTVRVALCLWAYPDDADASLIPALQSLYDAGDDMLRINQIKAYSDGIIINATSAFHDPYVDNLGLPFNTGLNYFSETRLANLIATLEPMGYDFHIHAIGDRAIHESLNAIETARNANGNIGARHRITHVEVVDPADYNRFAALNVTADMQVAGDFTQPANWQDNISFIGPVRSDNFVPVKSLFDADARIALSSDWDVSMPNPFVGMQNALTRVPQEMPSVAEVVKSYTIRAAYVMRHDDKTGSLEVGKFADFICVDRDIFTIPTNQISQTQVLNTFLGGQEIYRSATLPALPTPQPPVVVQTAAMLEAVYDVATNMMCNDLWSNNLLPLAQPYNLAPWNYNGSEQLANYNDFPNNTVDWILLELRDPLNNHSLVAQKAALLLTDGSIVDAENTTVTGVEFTDFCLPNSYYLVLRHRNHLDVMSANPINIPNAAAYDFSVANQALGKEQTKEVEPSVFALHAGDFNGDGLMTVADFNNYQASLSIINQYATEDVNMDATVSIADFNLYAPNASRLGIQPIRY